MHTEITSPRRNEAAPVRRAAELRRRTGARTSACQRGCDSERASHAALPVGPILKLRINILVLLSRNLDRDITINERLARHAVGIRPLRALLHLHIRPLRKILHSVYDIHPARAALADSATLIELRLQAFVNLGAGLLDCSAHDDALLHFACFAVDRESRRLLHLARLAHDDESQHRQLNLIGRNGKLLHHLCLQMHAMFILYLQHSGQGSQRPQDLEEV
mmetsp:Transcript_32930/g.86513  ORF Transcript_32930/g.86513 Transcript_32930/m.86513 type:complete len:220 (+) Transcript_32930:46-705(+)